MASLLHFHKQLAIPASSHRLSGHQHREKENSHNFISPSKNSSFSELQGWKKWKYKGNKFSSHLENVYLDDFFSVPLSRHIYQVENVSSDKLDVIPIGNIRMSVKSIALAIAWGRVNKGMLTIGIWDHGDLMQLQT